MSSQDKQAECSSADKRSACVWRVGCTESWMVGGGQSLSDAWGAPSAARQTRAACHRPEGSAGVMHRVRQQTPTRSPVSH